ncbi:MAG: hypothetical protein R3222_10480 [Balneolaceae bacterium]|nr:hypothetical protein [Balneolaceae bacterium]
MSTQETDNISVESPEQGSKMLNSEAPFSVLNQGFNHDTKPWVDQNVNGPFGWCGTIERIDRREVSQDAVQPSAGRSYATVSNGSCNEFWNSDAGFGEAYTSAPASGPNPDLMSSTWPDGGFVQQVDVYLDPDHPAGNQNVVLGPEGGFLLEGTDDVVFTYANSICATIPCVETFDFRYFAVSVIKDGEALEVAGHSITEPGWYTFRHVFDSKEDGSLKVDFQLLHKGQALATTSIDNTFLSGETTGDFKVDDLGSGYIWFVSIAEDLKLPIDEHRLRPGN